MKTSFQAGVDAIYNAIVGQGVTPAGKTPADLATGIGNCKSIPSNTFAGSYHDLISDTFPRNVTMDIPKNAYAVVFCMVNAGNYRIVQPTNSEKLSEAYYSIASTSGTAGCGLYIGVFKMLADGAITCDAGQYGYNFTRGAIIFK